jgi:hypothetical protein
MALKISKIFFTATVTAPTFLSLGLIGIVKDSNKYIDEWKDLWTNCIAPDSFEWWAINASLLFMLLCLIGVRQYLKYKYSRPGEGNTITTLSYVNLSQNGSDQILSSIIPWLTIFADKLDFKVLFVCIVLQCCFIAIASYNNSNYNLLCSILGYRYYEVHTANNTYILLSNKCIKNTDEIKSFAEVTDYMGLII